MAFVPIMQGDVFLVMFSRWLCFMMTTGYHRIFYCVRVDKLAWMIFFLNFRIIISFYSDRMFCRIQNEKYSTNLKKKLRYDIFSGCFKLIFDRDWMIQMHLRGVQCCDEGDHWCWMLNHGLYSSCKISPRWAQACGLSFMSTTDWTNLPRIGCSPVAVRSRISRRDLMYLPQLVRNVGSALQIARMNMASANFSISSLFVPKFSCKNSNPSSSLAWKTLTAFSMVNENVLVDKITGLQFWGRDNSQFFSTQVMNVQN